MCISTYMYELGKIDGTKGNGALLSLPSAAPTYYPPLAPARLYRESQVKNPLKPMSLYTIINTGSTAFLNFP